MGRSLITTRRMPYYYDYFTTLKGVMQKEDDSNEEFYVEPKLKDLFKMKDYGPYGENGELMTCFLTTTTSPEAIPEAP